MCEGLCIVFGGLVSLFSLIISKLVKYGDYFMFGWFVYCWVKWVNWIIKCCV